LEADEIAKKTAAEEAAEEEKVKAEAEAEAAALRSRGVVHQMRLSLERASCGAVGARGLSLVREVFSLENRNHEDRSPEDALEAR